MVLGRETKVYRQDERAGGFTISAQDREKLLKPYLPSPPRTQATQHKPQPIRDFLQHQLDLLVFFAIHTLFSIYVRLRQTKNSIVDRTFAVLYYHHRAPELIKQDVKNLSKLPQHLSIILELKGEDHGTASLEGLMDDVAEVAAWCRCAGIPFLSVYEKTGILKGYIPATQRAVSKKMHAYFGANTPPAEVTAPHLTSAIAKAPSEAHEAIQTSKSPLSILLISAEDGRSTLVDLTKTLTEMSQRGKLLPEDVSQDLIDAEISESVMMEPDLLILFTPRIQLHGFPPWQARLTEIFHVEGNHGVGYQVFLRALHNFANAQLKFGR